MTIQYHHQMAGDDKRTIAIVVPSKETLLSLMGDPEKDIVMEVGVAFCSPKDQYSKKTGRELSSDRMSAVVVSLDSVIVDKADSNVLYIQLRNKTNTLPEYFAFRVNLKAPRTHYIGS
jgi:hypothetical protein